MNGENDLILDSNVLAELQDLLPKPLFDEHLSLYIQELKSDSDSLLKIATELDRASFTKHVHRTAGSAAVFGAVNLRTRLLKLESALPKMKAEELFKECTQLQNLAEVNITELEAVLAQ